MPRIPSKSADANRGIGYDDTTNQTLDAYEAALTGLGLQVGVVELAGLAATVARLDARFVLKDADSSLGGAA